MKNKDGESYLISDPIRANKNKLLRLSQIFVSFDIRSRSTKLRWRSTDRDRGNWSAKSLIFYRELWSLLQEDRATIHRTTASVETKSFLLDLVYWRSLHSWTWRAAYEITEYVLAHVKDELHPLPASRRFLWLSINIVSMRVYALCFVGRE